MTSEEDLLEDPWRLALRSPERGRMTSLTSETRGQWLEMIVTERVVSRLNKVCVIVVTKQLRTRGDEMQILK